MKKNHDPNHDSNHDPIVSRVNFLLSSLYFYIKNARDIIQKILVRSNPYAPVEEKSPYGELPRSRTILEKLEWCRTHVVDKSLGRLGEISSVSRHCREYVGFLKEETARLNWEFESFRRTFEDKSREISKNLSTCHERGFGDSISTFLSPRSSGAVVIDESRLSEVKKDAMISILFKVLNDKVSSFFSIVSKENRGVVIDEELVRRFEDFVDEKSEYSSMDDFYQKGDYLGFIRVSGKFSVDFLSASVDLTNRLLFLHVAHEELRRNVYGHVGVDEHWKSS